MPNINDQIAKDESLIARRRKAKLRYNRGTRVRQITVPSYAVPLVKAVHRELNDLIRNIEEAYEDGLARKEALRIREIRIILRRHEHIIEIPEDSPIRSTFEEMFAELEKTLAERGDAYGGFNMNADIAAKVIAAVAICPDERAKMVMSIIAFKLARLCFDPYHTDSWHDIAGYALLAQHIQETPHD